MKLKKLIPAAVLLALTLILYIVASVLFAYTTKPEITDGEFQFSITYEYKGETRTLSGVVKCSYSGSDTVQGEHNRYWDEEVIYQNPINPEKPHIVDENEEMQTVLSLQPNMVAGYFMGDPLYRDYYQAYGVQGPEPYIEYYDYKNNISLDEENRDRVLQSIGFKILDFTYEKPIENSFSFSGIRYEADNVIIFVAISLVFLILCLIFVRRDKEYRYSALDSLGIALNALLGIIAVPFITIICILFGIVESNVELVNQIIYNIPPIAILCLALSVVLRRKGFSKSGFAVQFGAVLPFALMLVLEAVL